MKENTPNTEVTADTALILPNLCHYTSAASPLPLVAVEGDTYIIRYVNPAFCKMSGTSCEKLLGKDFCVIVPEGTANECKALLADVLSSGTTETLADQEHGAAIDKIYWSYTAWPVLDHDEHPVGLLVQITDTTEAYLMRQQSAALNESLLIAGLHQHTLKAEADDLNVRLERSMQETQHRVKNNLQILSALVEIQIAAEEIVAQPEALKRVGSYIHSLALLHDLLTQKVKSDANDDTLSTIDSLSQLLPLLQSSIGASRQIITEVEDITFPSFTIVSLSLLVNELITNAAKHSTGDIFLRIVQDGRHAILTVSNEGGAFPPNFDPVRDAHTGMGLILSFARHDLRGTIEFCNPPEGGACVTVRFPIPLR